MASAIAAINAIAIRMLVSLPPDGESQGRRSNCRKRLGQALTYGQSITDACLGWTETVPVLHDLADAIRARK